LSVKIAVGQNGRRSKLLSVKMTVGQSFVGQKTWNSNFEKTVFSLDFGQKPTFQLHI
jgi:hypothetical protein